MSKTIYVPQQVELLINKLRNEGFVCYLTGGAVRNQLTDIPVKDWDIIVLPYDMFHNAEETANRILKVLPNEGIRPAISVDDPSCFELAQCKVLKVSKDGLGEPMVDIDIICRMGKDIHAIFELFPSNCCKVALRPDGGVIFSDDFLLFHENKTILYYPESSGKFDIGEYEERMMKYYPDYLHFQKLPVIPSTPLKKV